MRTSVIVPFCDAKPRIPALQKALGALARKTRDLEILFVDNGSTDGSAELLSAARLPSARVLSEPRRGFAEPLNLGLANAAGELLLFLDADSLPSSGWATEMERALADCDLAVGETVSIPPKKPTPYGRLAGTLFKGHSARTARAQGHALPWGPANNLGFRRSLLEKVGIFSPEAGGAFDIDWCWRALLKGARLRYATKAVVNQIRANERRPLLEQFERFGQGEAWLHRTYAFLLSPEDREPDPLISSVDAFTRLRHYSQAAKVKALGTALDEVATAFAGGVRLGYERPHRKCLLEREAPGKAISWQSGAKTTSVFVPGKGLAQLEGKPLQLWSALQDNTSEEELVRLCMRLFRLGREAAEHELHEFLEHIAQ